MSANIVLPTENSYIVPGSTLIAGEYPGSSPSNPTSELESKLAGFLDVGITAFIDLSADADRLEPYEQALRRLATGRGIAVDWERIPIPDMGVCDAKTMRRVLDTVDSQLADGRIVYLHCWGGIGRTGTAVGCWLVRHGHTPAAALEEVGRLWRTMPKSRHHRHQSTTSPQTKSQRNMILAWDEPASEAAAIVEREVRPPLDRARVERAHTARTHHTRMRGCLLGGAVGDALGWPVEFLRLQAIRERHGPDGIQWFDADARGGLGAVTDDTQMTLFTAEGILRSTTRHMEHWATSEPMPEWWTGENQPHPDVMLHAYQRWLETQGYRAGNPAQHEPMALIERGWLLDQPGLRVQRAPGNTCLGALQGGRSGSVNQPLNDSKGCGGVMRVAPIGLVPTADPFAYAVAAAALTHGHPSGYLSAGAYAQIISDLLFDRVTLRDAVERAIARLTAEPGHEETIRALQRALDLAASADGPTAERVESLGAGWTGEEALAIGVYCALVADSFAHGVRLAVNHSGDSDSTGSIAGALLGVQCGEYGIPSEYLDHLELRDVIRSVADDLMIGYGAGARWRTRYPGC